MPYIKKSRREAIFSDSITDYDNSLQNAGELNFALHVIIFEYLDKHGLNYQSLNDIVGVCECVKLELSRRVIGIYEDIKIQENGDLDEYKRLIKQKLKKRKVK